MRITKYRGKREDNREWVYGAFYPIKDEDVYFIINNCKSIDFDDDDTTFNGYKVHKKSVGEFTGLHDKNRKEIYEGDILKTPSDYFCYVVFEDTGFAVKSYGSEAIDWEFSTFYKECEVIGNIYENPELLKAVSSKNKA